MEDGAIVTEYRGGTKEHKMKNGIVKRNYGDGLILIQIPA